MGSTVWSFVVSTFLYSVSILRVSDAVVCRDDDETREYRGDELQCSYGCCGEENNQVCCPQPEKSFTSTEIGVIAGSTIFGVIVVVSLIVLLVWIGKKFSTHFKELRRKKEMRIEINVNEPYVASPNDPVHVVPSPFQQQPSALAAPLHGNDDLDFGNEENWDRWGDGVPFSTDDVEVWTTDTAHSAARGRDHAHSAARGRDHPHSATKGRDHPHFQPPPSYETVVQQREQD